MEKAKDEMRPEYKRSDFATLERGKFYEEVTKGTAVALLEPPIARAFPTSKAVNDALHGLLALIEQTSRLTNRDLCDRSRRKFSMSRKARVPRAVAKIRLD